MLHTLLLISEQVAVLFLLMLLGFFFGKKRMLDDATVRSLNAIILNVVIPCTVISGFQSDRAAGLVGDLLLCCLYSVLVLLLFFAVSALVTRKLPPDEQAVYGLSSSLTNCSFMGYPLETALIGPLGIFYGSGFAAVMNLFTFTLGYLWFTRDRKSISIRFVLTRPAILSVLAAFALLLLRIRLPSLLLTAVNDLSSLCVPIPMLIIGYHLSRVDFRSVLRNRRHVLFTLFRLLVLPFLALGLLLILGARGNVLAAVMIPSACPVATVVTILAGQFGDRETDAAELNAMQTACSLLTIPPVMAIVSNFM